MGLGTAVRANVCSCTIGMGTGNNDSMDVEIDANFFAVWGAESAVGNLRPSWFAVREFRCGVSIVIMFADCMVQFTTEDAADLVT